jgi:sarcosine oxidase, subunit gamma
MSHAAIAPVAGVTSPAVVARYGAKGNEATGWLTRNGIPVPAGPNRFTHWQEHGGGRCLRLGNSEFLIEHDATVVAPSTPAPADAAWLLLRSDHSLLLDGPQWPDALTQVCSFDFSRFHDEPDMVVMTLLAGIGVTLVREPRATADDRLALRLWCDASYATYLQQCLQQLARPPISPGESR